MEIMAEVERAMGENQLTEAKVYQASHTAKGLYAWINAVRTYFFVYRDS